MMTNLHKVERLGRVVVGAIIASWAAYTGFHVFFAVAGVLAGSGLVGFCPVYRLFSFETK